MNIKVYKFKDKLYITLGGRVVLEECDAVKNAILPLIDRSLTQIYVDLEKVTFIDSAGLGVLVGLKMTSNKNKARLILVNPSKGVYDILYVSKLDNIFDITTGKEAEISKQTIIMEENLVKDVSDEKEQIKESSISPKIPIKPVVQQPKTVQDIKPATEKPMQPSPIQEPLKAQAITEDKSDKSNQELIDDYCHNAVEYMRQGFYEKAVEEYKKALSINPEYLPALNNLAIVYEKKPSWNSKAIEQWEKVLTISQREGDPKHIDRAKKHLENLRKMV